MALPSQFAQLDGLIDLVVEQLVREIEGANVATPPGSTTSTEASVSAATSRQLNNGQFIASDPS
jgi:hypothetical protein